jgi:hypothetical protein
MASALGETFACIGVIAGGQVDLVAAFDLTGHYISAVAGIDPGVGQYQVDLIGAALGDDIVIGPVAIVLIDNIDPVVASIRLGHGFFLPRPASPGSVRRNWTILMVKSRQTSRHCARFNPILLN